MGRGADTVDDAPLRRLDPLALFVELGIHLYCHDDFGSGGNDVFGLLDDGFECGGHGLAAAGEQTSGAGVAGDGGTVGQAIGPGEGNRALPAEEGFVNGVAVWMPANIALNAMVGGVGAAEAVGLLAGIS